MINSWIRLNRAWFASALMTLSAVTASNAFAGVKLNENLVLSGFAAQSYVKSWDTPYMSDNSLQGDWDFREISANLNWQVTRQLRFHGQVISQRLGELNDGDPQVDFLLAEWNHSAQDYNLGVRLGRVKTPYGLLNTVRDLPSARPGFALPSAIYLEGLRDMMLSTDGVNGYAQWFHPSGDFELDVFLGKREVSDESLERQYLQRDIASGDFDDITKKGARLHFSPAGVPDLTLGASWLNIDAEFVGDLALQVDSHFYLASAQYYWKQFEMCAEYAQGGNEVSLGAKRLDLPSDGYYAQFGWSVFPNFTAFVTHEHYERTRNNGTGLNKQTANTLGLRWQFAKNWSLNSHYSYVRGSVLLPVYNDQVSGEAADDWRYWGSTLSYQF